MKFARHLKWSSLALIAVSSFAPMLNAYAVGTESGTSISNQATVTYRVGTADQTPVTSNTETFLVDSRIDLTVTRIDTGPVVAAANEQAVVATFTVTNTGNSTQSYRLQAIDTDDAVFGNADTLDGLVLTTAVDTNGNGTYDTGTDQVGNLADIAPASSPVPVRVFVLANIPAGATNGQFASIRLTVSAAVAGSAGATLATENSTEADDPDAVDVVFADADENGLETIDGQYTIETATLSAVKTVTVIDDFFSASNPKAIPGAIVEYTIQIENTGSAEALDVTVADTIPANTTFVAGSLVRDGATLTDAADADGAQANGSPVSDIAITVPSIAAGATSTVSFRVTIQ